MLSVLLIFYCALMVVSLDLSSRIEVSHWIILYLRICSFFMQKDARHFFDKPKIEGQSIALKFLEDSCFVSSSFCR